MPGFRLAAATPDFLALAEWKRQFLDASMADKAGGRHSTGVRYWLIYHCYVLGTNPIPDPRDRRYEVLVMWEDRLEDVGIWIAIEKPYGNSVSYKSIGKYCSSIRSWYGRFYRAQLGLGATNGRITDLLKGYARLVDQPPPREREGCTPAALAEGMAVVRPGQNWRAALTFGMAALARGIEFALDGARGEKFTVSEHMTAKDVKLFQESGFLNASIKMRKRKDLRVLRGKHSDVVLGGGGGGFFDPVDELMEWLRQRRAAGIPDDAPLFCHWDGRAFDVREVRAMVKACMEAVGLDPALFGAHSLRIGGATAALAAGVPPSMIRLMGRWSSDVYEIYCRLSLQSAAQFGRSMARAMVTPGSAAFHQEHFELLPQEMADAGRTFSVADDCD